jgi:DNA-binding CsgD family transcriptional regulator
VSSIEHSDRNDLLAKADIDDLCRLVRSMVAITATGPAACEPSPGVGPLKHVVLDIDVDGSRYVLIKTVHAETRAHSLSPRESEIVRMVALGHPNKVIAAVLNISSWTVCTHVRRIFTKLGVTTRAAMVAKVTDIQGLVPSAKKSDAYDDRPALHRPLTPAHRGLARKQATTAE